jgi:hypothetical protein
MRNGYFVPPAVLANRVPAEKTAQGLKPVCGKCKKPLPIDATPLTVTDTAFSAEVERSQLPAA